MEDIKCVEYNVHTNSRVFWTLKGLTLIFPNPLKSVLSAFV